MEDCRRIQGKLKGNVGGFNGGNIGEFRDILKEYVVGFRAILEECGRIQGHLGGMWEDSGPSWRNVTGFRANLDKCSRIQGQLGGMYQDSETTRGNYRHIKGHREGIIGGFKANLEECSRIQGQLGGM